MNKIELLAPAGNMEKFKTAIHFGADAVYLSGKQFGLRAFADNFTEEEIAECCRYAHDRGKKVYVTVNVYPRNAEVDAILPYLKTLEQCRADGIIAADPAVVQMTLKHTGLPVHLSTQANTVNYRDVLFWRELGVRRVVLARELSLTEIREIAQKTAASGVELEVFVHGAMCISYSGRCLLSNYLAERDSNRGACVQACRWEWKLREVSRTEELTVQEDAHGTYFLNSKDLNTLQDLPQILRSGVSSLKIEGRMKTVYYVATVVNAYRRAIDAFLRGEPLPEGLARELTKASHRDYTTGFYFPERQEQTENYRSSKAVSEGAFTAVVLGYENGKIILEQRNRFREGDRLQVLSPDDHFGKIVEVRGMTDESGTPVTDAKLVQQKLFLPSDLCLCPLDVLSKV